MIPNQEAKAMKRIDNLPCCPSDNGILALQPTSANTAHDASLLNEKESGR